MYTVELLFTKESRLIINGQDKHYIELSRLAYEIDKDCELLLSAPDVRGEIGSFIVEFEKEENADSFIQSLQKLSYIKGNPQVELCDD
jgi:hypothetical protein